MSDIVYVFYTEFVTFFILHYGVLIQLINIWLVINYCAIRIILAYLLIKLTDSEVLRH